MFRGIRRTIGEAFFPGNDRKIKLGCLDQYHLYLLDSPEMNEYYVTELVQDLGGCKVLKNSAEKTLTRQLSKKSTYGIDTRVDIVVHLCLFRDMTHLLKSMTHGGDMLAWDGKKLWTNAKLLVVRDVYPR